MKFIRSILFSFCVIVLLPISDLIGQDDVTISLLTCAPGKDIYSIYGHNGIRIHNQSSGSDMVYNYGTFDFKEKGFMIKFMRGKLPYTISVAPYDRFLYEYNYFNRSVREQVLHLDSTEKQKIVQFIDWNMLEENKTYKYDFFRDNCATRVRDILDNHISGLLWNTDLSSAKTFRQIIKEYQKDMPWTDFGIDLIIGAPADKVTTLSEETFIPDYLAKAVGNARKKALNTSLQQTENQVLTFETTSVSNYFLLSPWFVFGMLLLIEIIIFYWFASGKEMGWVSIFDRFWIWTIILSALLMVIMWFATDHIPTKYNYNLLWCSPLVPVFYFLRERRTKFKWILWTLLILLGISILNSIPGLMFLPQYFHPLVILISTILVLKVVRWYKEKV
ncbi:MAG: DUF4105 domain-containing protein [Saprospiraceae bacterium]|jgi:hypothetical protein|nr:DUF4105 domain-containing protein [Saprospiraceae bacterium]